MRKETQYVYKKWSPVKYIRNYKFNSLFLKNFLLIELLVFLPVAAMCIGIYFYFQNTYLNEINGKAQSALYRIQTVVDSVMNNITLMEMNLCADPNLISVVEYEGEIKNNFEFGQQVAALSGTLIKNCNEYIQSVYVYSEVNDHVYGNFGGLMREIMDDDSWYVNYEKDKRNGSILWPRVGRQDKSSPEKPCISVATYLPYNQKTEKNGVVVMNVNNVWLDNLVSVGASDCCDFFIVGTDGSVIYNRDVHQVNQKFEGIPKESSEPPTVEEGSLIREGSVLMNGKLSQNQKWYYYYYTDLSTYWNRLGTLRWILMISAMLLLLLTALGSFMITVRVFLPVKNIIEMLEDPREFYNTNIPESGKDDEMKYITSAFFESYNRQESDRKALTEYVTRLKEAQIALLQTQINPHFLFNTLQTINFLAIANTQLENDISRAIESLSVMMRGMIEIDQNMITIEEELLYSQSYIKLEQLRYGEQLQVHWSIPEKMLSCQTVKVIFQPILENSIRHGFKNLKYGGLIEVAGWQEEERLRFRIKDNGVGQDCAWIQKMNEELEDFQTLIGRHIGIKNVNQRIRMLFGKEYGVRILTVDSGFAVEIVIPKIIE